MAIVKMSRIEILALSKDEKPLVRQLQKLGCLEVQEIPREELPEELALTNETVGSDKKQLERIAWAIGQLGPFQTEKAPMFGGKPEVTRQDIEDLLAQKDELMAVVEQMETFERLRGDIRGRKMRLEAEKEQLRLWENLPVDAGQVADTQHTLQALGTIPTSNLLSLEEEWKGQPIYIEKVNTVRDSTYVAIIAHHSMREGFLAQLRGQGFLHASLEIGAGSPKEQMDAIEQEEKELLLQEEELAKELAGYAGEYKRLQLLFDALTIEEEQVQTAKRFVQTQSTFYVKGWVPEGTGEKVKETISAISPSAQVVLSEPKEDENPPVFLRNNNMVTPFESIVTGFSLPDYRGLDPTAVMMPFFLNFFGMMVSDAGYGLLMALLIPIIIKFAKPSRGAKNLMKMLAMGGVATVVWGFLYNTWFGFAPLPVLFDAVNDPIPVMAVCIGLGAVHLFAGLGVAAYMNIKRGKPLDAIYDQLSWVLLVVGVGMLIVPQVATVGKYMAITGVLIILLTAGRGNGKNPFKRLIGGLGALYGVTSWISDLLSYMRLFGMGLATGVIGMVINQLVGMVFDAGLIGKILGAALFCGGHLFNAGINVLGAYVHSCRLQYIEFFGKFYEDGGKPFVPLRENTRYVDIYEVEKAA